MSSSRPSTGVFRPSTAFRSRLLGRCAAAGLAVALGVGVGAAALDVAAQAPAPAASPAEQKDPPALLVADEMTFNEETGIVIATGNVELSQGARTVRSDVLTYNRNTEVVTATGNVRLIEPTGEILFADYAELTDDMRDAFVDNVRVLMTDNGRIAGTEAERRGGQITRINRAVYSPCDLCPEDPTRAPLWQIRAVRVVHDKEAREVRYRNARLEMFGIPVAFTPYLSHPDPTVDRKSGLLTPSFGSSSSLGAFLRNYYYIDIAPEQDATVEVSGFSKQGLLLGGEYRRRFENGRLQLNGSITRGELYSGNDVSKGDHVRGHVAAKGLFEINDVWRWGFDAERATDRSYLRRYYNIRKDVLTSRGFMEGFRGRNYAAVNAYSFQDLRYANPTREPVVVPEAVYSALGEPGSLFGGRWSFDAGVLSLARTDGPDTQRFTIQPGWRREIVSNAGFVTTMKARVLMAAYYTNDWSRAGTTETTVSEYRLFPQGQLEVRYPFVRHGESSQQLIEPVAALTFAPDIDDNDVPNEDSLDAEFDETNLFFLNRFGGVDRLDGGGRASYGLRAAIYGNTMGRASLFVGQSYRFYGDSGFPTGSGLEDDRSDIVGRLELSPGPWLDVSYGFRLDDETFEPRRHTLTASAGVPELTVSTNYTYVDQHADSFTGALNTVEQISLGLNSQFSRYWSLGLAHVHNLAPVREARASLAVLTYTDECLVFQTIALRNFTDTPGDPDSSSTIYFRFVFKNIGEFTSPNVGGFLLETGESSGSR